MLFFKDICGIYRKKRLPCLKIYLTLGFLVLAIAFASALIAWVKYTPTGFLEAVALGSIFVFLFFFSIWGAKTMDEELTGYTKI